MPHLSLDLDALERVPEVASAAGVPRGEVLFGLCGLWRWCWRERTDRITTEQLPGFFSPFTAQLPSALISFGFLASVPDGYRVRGADRYLRVKEAQSRAAERTNARRSTARSSDGTPSGLPCDGTPTALPHGTAHGLPHGTPSGQATVPTPSPPTPPSSPSEQRAASRGPAPVDQIGRDDPMPPPKPRVAVTATGPDGTHRELHVEVPPIGDGDAPTAYHVEFAWRKAWLDLQHLEATDIAHPAAKAARWATENGVTWGDLLPVLMVLAAKGQGLSLLSSRYDEIRAETTRGETDDADPLGPVGPDGLHDSRRVSSALIAGLDVPPDGPPEASHG